MYAIEGSALAKQTRLVVEENKMADRITVLQGRAEVVTMNKFYVIRIYTSTPLNTLMHKQLHVNVPRLKRASPALYVIFSRATLHTEFNGLS